MAHGGVPYDHAPPAYPYTQDWQYSPFSRGWEDGEAQPSQFAPDNLARCLQAFAKTGRMAFVADSVRISSRHRSPGCPLSASQWPFLAPPNSSSVCFENPRWQPPHKSGVRYHVPRQWTAETSWRGFPQRRNLWVDTTRTPLSCEHSAQPPHNEAAWSSSRADSEQPRNLSTELPFVSVRYHPSCSKSHPFVQDCIVKALRIVFPPRCRPWTRA